MSMLTKYVDGKPVFPEKCPAVDKYGNKCDAKLKSTKSGHGVFCPENISHYAAGTFPSPTKRDVFTAKGFDWVKGLWPVE